MQAYRIFRLWLGGAAGDVLGFEVELLKLLGHRGCDFCASDYGWNVTGVG